jgi:hypothetical protein
LRYFDGTQWTIVAPPPPPPPSIVINNNVAAPAPVVATNRPNYALHIVLTVLTCGLWLPVLLIVAISSHRVRVGRESIPIGNFIGAVFLGLLFLGLVVAYWQVFLGLAGVAILAIVGFSMYGRRLGRRADQAKIAGRADAQNQAFMSGDSSGVYGQYPPLQPPDLAQ